MIKALLSKYEYLIIAVAVSSVVLGTSFLTYKLVDSGWQSKWDKRENKYLIAGSEALSKQRERENVLQSRIDQLGDANAKRKTEYQNTIAKYGASERRLLDQINNLLADTSTEVTGSESRGKTTAEATNMLAIVLRKSIERNRQLAEFADNSYEAGKLCEMSYDAITSP